MAENVKVLLPEDMESSRRAYFYQSLSVIDFFMLPGTQIELDVHTDEENEKVAIYEVKIQLNSTIIKAAIRSEDYFSAIKKIFAKVADQLTAALKKVTSEQSKVEKAEVSEEKGKIIH